MYDSPPEYAGCTRGRGKSIGFQSDPKELILIQQIIELTRGSRSGQQKPRSPPDGSMEGLNTDVVLLTYEKHFPSLCLFSA